MVVEIEDAPKRITYTHNGLRYTLSAENKIDPVLHEEGSVLVLRGFSPEEVELLTGGTPDLFREYCPGILVVAVGRVVPPI